MISIVSYFAYIHESKGMKLLRHTWAALLCILFYNFYRSLFCTFYLRAVMHVFVHACILRYEII